MFSDNKALSIKDVIAMRQKLKEDAENGRTYSLRDIIAMKNDYLDDKSISSKLDSRFKRPPIPHASRYTNITPAKNHWLPKTTARTTTIVMRPTKSSLNLMDLIARRKQQHSALVTTARMTTTTTAPPAVRIQNAYAAQKARVLQGLGRGGMKETTTDRFRTRVVPFTTAPPRTYRTRHVPFGRTTQPLIKATILTTTARPRITRQMAISVPKVITTTMAPIKTTIHPVRAAFMRKLQMKTPTTTPATTITTTVAVEINTKDARHNFLEKLQAMKIGRTNAPAPETIKSTTQMPAAGGSDDHTPSSSRLEFFKKLKEQMMESNSTSLAKEIESKRQFFMRMMQNKVKTTGITTTTISNNRRVELEAINMAKANLMSKVKPTASSARLAFMQQLKEKKMQATKTTSLTLAAPDTTMTTTSTTTTPRPLTRDAASKARMEFLKRLQAQKSTPKPTNGPVSTRKSQIDFIEQMRLKTTKTTTTTFSTATTTTESSSTTLSARMAFLRQLQETKPEIVTTTLEPASNSARLAFMERLKSQYASVAPSTTIEPAVDAPYTISSSRLAFLKRLKEQRDALAKATTTALPVSAKLKAALTAAPTPVVPTFAPFQTQAPANDNSDPQLRSILCKLAFHCRMTATLYSKFSQF